MSYFLTNLSRIGGVIVTMLASSAVDREFKSRSEQTKGYNIGICCISAKDEAFKLKSNNLLARNKK